METNVFAWDEVAAVGDAKADRRVIEGVAGDLKRVAVKAGTVASRHAHEFEQFFMVLEGNGVLTTAGGETVLKPGVVVHFAPDAWHSAVFHEDTVLVEVNFRKVVNS
jgi:quercetin dioxygenase-like cupin family protein